MHFSILIGGVILLTGTTSAQSINGTETVSGAESFTHTRTHRSRHHPQGTSLPGVLGGLATACLSANSTSMMTVTVSVTSFVLPRTYSTGYTLSSNSSSASSSLSMWNYSTTTTLATRTSTSTTRDWNSSAISTSSGWNSSSTPVIETKTTLSSPSSFPISASPISTASTMSYPNATISPTTTISSRWASGTPNPAALLCGVHGMPIGDYALAEYWEDAAGVPVDLVGCYFFCATGYGYNHGCLSYEFYPEPGTGAARCRLYGGSVAESIASIIPQVPNVWYDLGCGVPS